MHAVAAAAVATTPSSSSGKVAAKWDSSATRSTMGVSSDHESAPLTGAFGGGGSTTGSGSRSIGAAIITRSPARGNGKSADVTVLFRRAVLRYGLRRYLYAAIALIVLFLCIRWLSTSSESRAAFPRDRLDQFGSDIVGIDENGNVQQDVVNRQPIVGGDGGNVIRLDVYMESQCPDTSRFIHKQLTPVYKKYASLGRIRLSVIPFGKAWFEPNGDISCQHGPIECEMNQLMNCLIDQTGRLADRYLPVLDCIQGQGNFVSASKCVQNKPGLDARRIIDCALGEKGRQLHALAGNRTLSLPPPPDFFIPWIVFDGVRIPDAIYALEQNLCQRWQPTPTLCPQFDLSSDDLAQ